MKSTAHTSRAGDERIDKGNFNTFQLYLSEIKQYQLLTREEEIDLAERIRRDDDHRAVSHLINANLRLVVKIAQRYEKAWKKRSLLDLIQEGNIGLIKAATKYDPEKNVKFSYYASFWIKAYILKYVMDNWSLVKIGTTRAQQKLFFSLAKEKQKLASQGFKPDPEVLSDRLGIASQEIINMDKRLEGGDVSLDAPLSDSSNDERIVFLQASDDTVEDKVSKKELESMLHRMIDEYKGTLCDRDKDILEERIFSDTPLTLRELGERHGVSRERVRQVEKSMLKDIKLKFLKYYQYADGQESQRMVA